jgi:NTP pyrophosphatase (non-canonical NTP hydrolase)
MSHLKEQATLDDFQAYISEHWRERGFDGTAVQECLLLAEEVGELAKAVRKESGMAIDNRSRFGKISHEIADVLWVTAAIANLYGINLEEAFREKEAINHGRTWQ